MYTGSSGCCAGSGSPLPDPHGNPGSACSRISYAASLALFPFFWADDGMQTHLCVHIFMDGSGAVAVSFTLQIGRHDTATVNTVVPSTAALQPNTRTATMRFLLLHGGTMLQYLLVCAVSCSAPETPITISFGIK